MALLEKEKAAEWMRTVNKVELERLGGDSNRIFQLLVDGKGVTADSFEVASAVLDVAVKRWDLFSPKQCEAIKKHKEQLCKEHVIKSKEAAELAKLREKEAEEEEKRKRLEALYEAERQAQLAALDESQSFPNGSMYPSPPVAHIEGVGEPFAFSNQETMATPSSPPLVVATSPTERSKSPSYAPSESLQAFLIQQERCIKGSPSDFCYWLWLLGIVTLEDLATAVLNDNYLRDVLQKGNGKVSVKKFKRDLFKKAVMEAALKESEVPPELLCPISFVIMSNDPVIAADGHTVRSWIA